ncbi:UDP-N-acetylglucosamine 2-epimerase (non-hydrolyzing) [Porphyrobacter sp. SLTP]|uniref:non-hydrolyzing UDP-N-acetylglucosamine 2-epimerase n=1 Tax=Porphyrobacter sp. SLTP TaxID=2683266 RepID=UPI0014120624|nr:UDP-N-acetylglucosamine 2-epimerase (non-hydrolyzing) [Porphyrobacter sp. SLTP]NBB23601.1 UDP-N-acetylglucosamine 2-epimerase (non-hydrolyzing) [Porphyrobacter sp. SLTP]
MKHFVIILGTRPEAIKLLPLYLELRKRDCVKATLILTGQHRELVDDVFRTFGCSPDISLNVMQPNQTLAGLTARVMTGLDGVLPEDTDLVIVQGDTASAFVGSLLAFYRGISSAHVEAGLRSGDLLAPFPEEFNRRAVSITSRWHFAPTDAAAENLAAEGIHDGVHVVGNTSIDAALTIAAQNQPPSEMLSAAVPELEYAHGKIILVTAHRRENFGEGIRSIIAAVRQIATERPDLLVVWPVHPNPNVRDIVMESLAEIPNIRLLEPLSYHDLLYVMQRSFIALSDSGGIQEEAPSFSCPVLVLRDTTERPEAIKAGCNVMVGTNSLKIVDTFNRIANNREIYRLMIEAKNPFGDGTASQKIAEILLAESIQQHV